MGYVGIFFAMLAITTAAAVVLVIVVDGLLHLAIFLTPKHLRELRRNGWHLEKHDESWPARLAEELIGLFDLNQHEWSGSAGTSMGGL